MTKRRYCALLPGAAGCCNWIAWEKGEEVIFIRQRGVGRLF